MKPLLFAVIAGFCASAPLPAATVEAILAKARAAAGDESALNAVKSLRYTIKASDQDGKPLGISTQEYKAPLMQRTLDYTLKDNGGHGLEVVTATDGVEGYRMIRRIDAEGHNLEIMPANDVNMRRDDTRENLTFFTPPNSARCTTVAAQDEKILGVDCYAVDYVYKTGRVLRQYVAKADGTYAGYRSGITGKLGPLIANKSTVKEGGINFPSEILIIDDAGKTLRTLKMEKIEVNPDLSDKAFATPLY